MAAIYTSSRANGAAVDASLDKADVSLPADQGTIQRYAETGTTLSISSGVLDIPLDGRIYQVSVTEEITSITTSEKPTAPLCGSSIVYFTQDATGYNVVIPSTWYCPDSAIVDIDSTAASMTRLTLTTDPVGNVHADAELRGIPT